MASVPEFCMVWPQTTADQTPGAGKRSHTQPCWVRLPTQCFRTCDPHGPWTWGGPKPLIPVFEAALGFSPHPEKPLVHGKHSTLILQILSTLGLSLRPPTSFFTDLILDLKWMRKVSWCCGLFLQAGLLELFVHPSGLGGFLVCNHVSPSCTASRKWCWLMCRLPDSTRMPPSAVWPSFVNCKALLGKLSTLILHTTSLWGRWDSWA